MEPVKVGLIGSGIISWTYLDNMVRRFDAVEVVGCSDLIPERSASRAAEFGIRQMTSQEIYDDPEIQIVVNTANWSSHTQVIREALAAGKHVYTEKSLASSFFELRNPYNPRRGGAARADGVTSHTRRSSLKAAYTACSP